MTPAPELIARAAANNAALCDAVCRANGVAGRFDPDAWVSPTRPPPRYPDAVTLRPTADRRDLLERVDVGAGCSVKDSFAVLDLSAVPGWSVLFEATWIGLDPTAVRDDGDRGAAALAGWEPVDDPPGLADWSAAWAGADGLAEDGPWRPSVLDEDLVVLASRRDAAVVAGAVVNVAAELVGISNVFTSDDRVDPWRSCLAWIAEHHPGRPVVGYESGDDLTAALGHGFVPIGPLRVWHRSG